ncbi:titin-like isoform X2 [Phlebotomus papatasi]|uniref:titin-like isoform X2 n=1 Tax=Phlebotomus papatasi TaxID=29031 RepID=UPI002484365A|nr:titin-like isoform X2 [Phlebotomus papatasi]
MSYNPKPLQVSSVAAPSIAPSADGQPAGQNAPQQPPSISQAAKLTPQPASQLTQAVNNLHVLAAGGGERLAQMHLQQQMVNFQNQTLLFQQQAGNPSGEPLALTRVVAEAAAKQANGSVSIVPQAAAHGPSMAHQLHTTSLKLTYQMQHKPATTSQPPAHMSSQPTSVQQQHHTATVAAASQAQVQHTPAGSQQPVVSQQKVPSPQKAAPPPQTRAPVAVATTTAAQSQLQANNNVPKAQSPQQVPQTPPKAPQPAPQSSKVATVVTPSKTTMKLATVTTPRIKQTARKNQAALTRPQSNFAAAAEAAAATKPSTSAAPGSAEKAAVPKVVAAPPAAPPAVPEKEKEKEKPKEVVKEAPLPKKEKLTPPAKTTPKQSGSVSTSSDDSSPLAARFKRSRTRTVPYQSPLPEYALLSKLSYAESSSSGSKNSDDKLVLFYKSEFMAVRNAEGGFFLCQAQHNVYKSSPRIRIQWLSEEKANSTMYIPDFYDITDLDCVLTSVELKKQAKKLYKLPEKELERIQNILKKALDVEKGILPRPDVTEENPDGLDLSLYKDESQLERSPKKRSGSVSKTPKRTKRTKVDDETPKRVSARTKSPRKNFAESDFELSEDEEPPKMPKSGAASARVGRPPKQATMPKVAPAKKTPVSTPTKSPAKSKESPKEELAAVEVVVPKEIKPRGRKRKNSPVDPLALPLAKKTPVQTLPDTPAAASAAKGASVSAQKKSQTNSSVAQSTKKPAAKGKKAEAVPEAAKKSAISPLQQSKVSPKAKVGKAQDTVKEAAAGGRMTRGRKVAKKSK